MDSNKKEKKTPKEQPLKINANFHQVIKIAMNPKKSNAIKQTPKEKK